MLSAGLVIVTSLAFADRVLLKNGTVVEGSEGISSGDRITLRTSEGMRTFTLAEIKSVEWDNTEIMDTLQNFWQRGAIEEFRTLYGKHINRLTVAEDAKVRQMYSSVYGKQSESKILKGKLEEDRASAHRKVDEFNLNQAKALESRHGWRSASEFLLTAIDSPDPLRECGYYLIKLHRTHASLGELEVLSGKLQALRTKSKSPDAKILYDLLFREHETFIEPQRLAQQRAVDERQKTEEAERQARIAKDRAVAEAEAREKARQEAAMKERQLERESLFAERRGRLERPAKSIVLNAVESTAGQAARSLIAPMDNKEK
jgi:hypothetical protein